MSKRAQVRRLLKRDKQMCGIHLGGCSRPINKGEPRNVDHIIPRAMFSMVAADRLSEFNEDWNCQPMHKTCNDSKDYRMDEWPQFQCECHYLQVIKDSLCIYTMGRMGEGEHRLL